ncbi:MAG: thiamine-phosphate kinase [Armatimonadota bacterium]
MSGLQLPGEDALIATLAGCLPPSRHTRLAIGDDAAAIAQPDGSLLLITTDLLMEDVHFRLRWGDLPALGWKALAQNLSDIAAMGGTPTHAVIALGLPAHFTPEEAVALYRGIAEMARESATDVIGGDTIRSSGPLTLGITVLGQVSPAEILTRSGAHPGDALFVTGTLGRAAAGLRVLDAGRPAPAALAGMVAAQLRPQPRLAAARDLAGSGLVTAMMDLSDGIATDLHRLCLSSGVGAVVERAALPVDQGVIDTCRWLTEMGTPCEPGTLALGGGEDFELLFTAPADAEDTLRARIAPLRLTRVGLITESTELLLHDGVNVNPLNWGFTHF